MRTLSAELTTAQQAQANTPYISVVLTARDNSATVTYTSDGATNRVIYVRSSEAMYGGALFDVTIPNGKVVAIATQIILRNSDNDLTSKDLRGYKVDIKWGFKSYVNDSGTTVAISGTKTSQGEPFFVLNQRDRTSPGEMQTELWCISVWTYLDLMSIVGDSFGDTYSTSGEKIRHLIMDSLLRQPNAVFLYNASLLPSDPYTSLTSALLDNSSTATLEVDLDDILYIGTPNTDADEFDRITIEFSTEGVGTWAVAVEYSDSSGFTAVSGLDDQTSAYKDGEDSTGAVCPKVISFDKPAAWVARDVNGTTIRWIRIRVTSSSTVTTKPALRRIAIQNHWGFQVDTTDAQENSSDLAPELALPIETSRRELIRDLLDRTQLKLIMGSKYFKAVKFETSPSADYSYVLDGAHTFFTGAREQALVLPNRVMATSASAGVEGQYKSAAQDDSASKAAFGVVLEIIVDGAITSVANANKRALRRLTRYQHEAYQGEISTPINIGQETWDWISVNDTRLSQTYTGRCGRIVREYDQRESSYRCLISLGETSSFPSIPKVPSSNFGLDYLSKDDPTIPPPARPLEDVPSERAAIEDTESAFGWEQQVQNPRSQGGVFNLMRFAAQMSEKRTGQSFNVTGRPAIPLFTGNTESGIPVGLWTTPQSNYYSVPKHNFARGTKTVCEHEICVDYFYFNDFKAGGYKTCLMYNDGAGRLILDGGGVGSGTIVTTLKLANFDTIEFGEDTSGETHIQQIIGAAGKFVFETGATGYIRPNVADADLGTATQYWDDIYGTDLFTHTVRPRTGTVLTFHGSIIPEAGGTRDSGSAANYWNNLYSNTVHTNNLLPRTGATITLNGNLSPNTGGSRDLGDATNYWDDFYSEDIFVNFIKPRTGSDIEFLGNPSPDTAAGYDLGTAALYWNNGRMQTLVANTMLARTGTSIQIQSDFLPSSSGSKDIGSSSLLFDNFFITTIFMEDYEEITEMTAPSAPAANKVRLYADDNGSGKTRIMALFSSGVAQQVAIQP